MGAGGSVSHPDPNQSHGHGGEALIVSFPDPMLTVTVNPPSPYMAPATALPWTRISHTQTITDSSGVLHVGHDNNKEVLCIARGRLPDGSIRIGARAVTSSGYLKGHASIAFNGQEVQLDDCDVLLVAPNMVMAPWTIGSPPPPNAVVCGQIGMNPVFAGTAILSVNGSPDQLVVPGSVLPQGIMLALMGKQISINSGLISVLCVQPTINPSGWCPPMTNAQYWEQLARQNQALMMSRSGFGGGGLPMQQPMMGQPMMGQPMMGYPQQQQQQMMMMMGQGQLPKNTHQPQYPSWGASPHYQPQHKPYMMPQQARAPGQAGSHGAPGGGFSGAAMGAATGLGAAGGAALAMGQDGLNDAAGWATGAANDVAGWAPGAANDAAGWASGAANDAAGWASGAASDVAGWAPGAASEIADWGQGAVGDMQGWGQDFSNMAEHFDSGGAFDGLSNAFANVDVGGAFNDVGNDVSDAFNDVGNALEDLF